MGKPKAMAVAHIRAIAWGIVSTAMWMLCSSALVILNAQLYKGNAQLGQGGNGRAAFPFPWFVTAGGQLFSALGGVALAAIGLLPLRGPPAMRFWLRNILPVVVATTATMFFGGWPSGTGLSSLRAPGVQLKPGS
jgi:hypothetical protein